MAENYKPAPPAEGAEAVLGASTEKPNESVAPQSTEHAEKSLEANVEKKEIDDIVSGTPEHAVDEKKAEEPMPPVAPQPAVGVESAPTETSKTASDAVPVTATSPSTVPTIDAGATTESTTGPAVNTASATAAVTTATAPVTGTSAWPETAADHPLTKFYEAFEALVSQTGHDEVYGIKLSKSDEFHTKLVLQKFLRANANDLEKAKQQLLETLIWRKEFDPTKAADEVFDKTKFDGLGYIIEVDGVPESENKKDVVTFNIYGAVKDNKATFGDLEA